MRENIKNIDDLKELMISEAETWDRTNSAIVTSNSDGIEEQWQTLSSGNLWPAAIFATIYNMETKVFEMLTFWFNKKGQRMPQPEVINNA